MSKNVKPSFRTNRKQEAELYRRCPHCGKAGNNIRTLRKEGTALIRTCDSCKRPHTKDISNGFK